MDGFLDDFLLDDDGDLIEVLFADDAEDGALAGLEEEKNDGAVDSGAVEPSPAENEREKPKRQRHTMKHELDYLRGKHDALVEQLNALKKSTNKAPDEENVWAQRAKEQAKGVLQVKMENARLKRALDEQLSMVRALQRVFTKKPRWSTATLEDLSDWKVGTLRATNRRETMDRLLEHHYFLLETQWIRNNMYANRAQPQAVNKAFIPAGESMVVHYVQCSTWPVPYTVVAEGLWDMACAKFKAEAPFSYEANCIERFDENTTYSKFTAYAPDNLFPPVDGLLATRRYIEDKRIVLVYRSILDDALIPQNPSHLKDNRGSWVTIEPWGENGQESRLCALTCQSPPMGSSDHVEHGFLSEFMLQSFAESSKAFDDAVKMAIKGLSLL